MLCVAVCLGLFQLIQPGVALEGGGGVGWRSSLGGAVPAAAAPRHRHHSPHNEPRVRWEVSAVGVGSATLH